MDAQLYKALSQKYKNFAETRTPQQIFLTTRLARALTQINIKRVMAPKSIQKNYNQLIRKEQFLYVYCFGTPPYDSQMHFLKFPGQTIAIKYKPLIKGLPQQQTKRAPYTFVQWAKILNQQINKASKTKPIVLAYHSFGTYFVSTYIQLFPNDRIVGMIDIGGLPLRFFPETQQILGGMENFTIQQIQESIEEIYNVYKATMTGRLQNGDRSINSNLMQNKYQLLAIFKCITNQFGLDWAYDQHKKWPKILKCFIFGRNDMIFTQPLLCEKAIYYAYKNKFDQNYEKILQENYQKTHGQKVTNVQQRFIFNVKGGTHSLHLQKKNKELIQNIISQYLNFIQQVYSLSRPKL